MELLALLLDALDAGAERREFFFDALVAAVDVVHARDFRVRTLAACGPILDLRSGDYARLAPLPGALVARVVAADGRAVSHDNKSTKGVLARALAGSDAESIEEIATTASRSGLVVVRTGPKSLDVAIG